MDAHRASLSTQVLYGTGSISVGIKNNLLGTYLLIYYNQVLGLDAGVAALAMAIALAVDAVSDPLVGIWSDRARTRWGRRHPFMYAALVPSRRLTTFFCPIQGRFQIKPFFFGCWFSWSSFVYP